jgi:hypothetical protein
VTFVVRLTVSDIRPDATLSDAVFHFSPPNGSRETENMYQLLKDSDLQPGMHKGK